MQTLKYFTICLCVAISFYIPTISANSLNSCWSKAQSSPYYLLAMGANTNKLTKTSQDVNLFVQSMQKSYGIPKQNICKLANISRKTMQRALAKLKNSTTKKHTIFIYFSGHGTVLPGNDGGKDCKDEALVTVKGKVRDNDFIKWVNPISQGAKKVYVVLDTCFSGGFNRNVCPSLKMKYVENKACPKVKGNNFRNLRATLFAASQEQQAAWEDKNNGLFTHYLSVFLKKKHPLETAFAKAKPRIINKSMRKGKACKQVPVRYK